MAKLDNMAAKLAEQSAKRKAELAATVNEIKGEEATPVAAEEPKKATRKRATASKPKTSPKAAPLVDEEEVKYDAKRGRKSKYQPKDPRHPTTIVFTESQYWRLKDYAYSHKMSISDVLIEAFERMVGEE